MKIHEWKVIIWFIFDAKAGMVNLNSVRLPVSFTSIMLQTGICYLQIVSIF